MLTHHWNDRQGYLYQKQVSTHYQMNQPTNPSPPYTVRMQSLSPKAKTDRYTHSSGYDPSLRPYLCTSHFPLPKFSPLGNGGSPLTRTSPIACPPFSSRNPAKPLVFPSSSAATSALEPSSPTCSALGASALPTLSSATASAWPTTLRRG